MNKKKKICTVLAATAVFSMGMTATAFAEQGWTETDDGWKYYDEDGYQVTDEWKKSGDNWFYLDEDGNMVYEQIIEYDGDYYYVNEDGAMVKNEWIQMANDDDTDENDAVDVWYYFQNNGKAYVAGDNGTSFKTINGQKYAFDEEGKMLWGWVNDDSETCNSDTEWQNAIYYCGAEDDGAMKTGWQLIDVEEDREDLEKNKDDDDVMYYYFYFRANGKRVENGTKTINGLKYSFDEYGAMDYEWTLASGSTATSSVATAAQYKYYNYEDYGNRVKGWFYAIPSENINEDDYNDEVEHWYYADGSGDLAYSEIKTINGKKYAFNEKGEMLYDLQALVLDPNDSKKIIRSYHIEDENDMDAFIEQNPEYSGGDGTFDFTNSMLFYFGEDSDDGAMKTGTMNLYFEGETYHYYFLKSGSYKGAAFGSKAGLKNKYDGTYTEGDETESDSFIYDDKYIYREGRRKTADSDEKYAAFDAFGNEVTDPDEFENGTAYLVNTSGNIQKKKRNIKDRDGNYYCTNKDGIIIYYGTEKCNDHNSDVWHVYNEEED